MIPRIFKIENKKIQSKEVRVEIWETRKEALERMSQIESRVENEPIKEEPYQITKREIEYEFIGERYFCDIYKFTIKEYYKIYDFEDCNKVIRDGVGKEIKYYHVNHFED